MQKAAYNYIWLVNKLHNAIIDIDMNIKMCCAAQTLRNTCKVIPKGFVLESESLDSGKYIEGSVI